MVQAITRRRDTVLAYYDSRNRDTLGVIPGVGNVRKEYRGPQDQLTAMLMVNAVDSIGGLNGDHRWGYDGWGRLAADTSWVGSTVLASGVTYDSLDRVSYRTDQLSSGAVLGPWRNRYEPFRGLVSALITPLGDSVTMTYDAQSRLVGEEMWRIGSGLTGGTRLTRGIGYTKAGTVKSVRTLVPDDPLTTGTYEGFSFGHQFQDTLPEYRQEDGQPWREPLWVAQRGPGTLADSLTERPVYDAWWRLTDWSLTTRNGTVFSEGYSFDAAGNVSQPFGGAVYDTLSDRLLARSEGGVPRRFGYDAAGNLVADTTFTSTGAVSAAWAYSYDALNRLTAVRRNGVLIARYGYDVLGRRIVKRVYSGATGGTVGYTRFVYAGGQLLLDADSASTVQRRYTWGPGQDNLLAIDDGTAGGHYYTVQDRLGSIRGLVKQDGTWVGTIAYKPYGTTARTTGLLPSWLRQRWAGQEYDVESGLYYMRARYYSPGLRRFIQEDPIGHAGGRNVYAYVDGQVLETRDPDGLWATVPTPVVQLCQGDGCFEENPAAGFGAESEAAFWSIYSESRPQPLLQDELASDVAKRSDPDPSGKGKAICESLSKNPNLQPLFRGSQQKMMSSPAGKPGVGMRGVCKSGCRTEWGQWLDGSGAPVGGAYAGEKPGHIDPYQFGVPSDGGIFVHSHSTDAESQGDIDFANSAQNAIDNNVFVSVGPNTMWVSMPGAHASCKMEGK